jgi:hypothetical protein
MAAGGFPGASSSPPEDAASHIRISDCDIPASGLLAIMLRAVERHNEVYERAWTARSCRVAPRRQAAVTRRASLEEIQPPRTERLDSTASSKAFSFAIPTYESDDAFPHLAIFQECVAGRRSAQRLVLGHQELQREPRARLHQFLDDIRKAGNRPFLVELCLWISPVSALAGSQQGLGPTAACRRLGG